MNNNNNPYLILAEFYDELLAVWDKDYPEEVQKLHAIIQQHKRSSGYTLLDVGCGTGEHIRHLQNHYEVTGLDSSDTMLDIAKKKLPHVTFHNLDMTSFELHKKFDVITSLFSGIGYVETLPRLQQTITAIYEHLHPGGVAVIEPWFTPDDFEKHRSDVLFGERGNFKACRMRESIVENGIAKINEHILISKDLRVIHFTTKHIFGLFSKSDFFSIFETSGFQAKYIEGGLDGRGLYIGIKMD